jgi:hypothetical protein
MQDMSIIIFNGEKTWPHEIIDCIERHHDKLYSWEAQQKAA